MKHPSFDETIPALDAETSVLGAAIARRSFDATTSMLDAETPALDAETSALDAETSALDAETSALYAVRLVGDRTELPAMSARSFRRYRRLRSWYNSADV